MPSAEPPRTFCDRCGTRFDADTWPRTCPGCQTTAYRNPLAVAVCLTPVLGDDRRGLLVLQRTLRPAGTALPGGYVDWGESIAEAALRELREETGLEALLGSLSHSAATPDGSHLLCFCHTGPVKEAEVRAAPPSNETSGADVVWDASALDLVFDLHQAAARAWFADG